LIVCILQGALEGGGCGRSGEEESMSNTGAGSEAILTAQTGI